MSAVPAILGGKEWPVSGESGANATRDQAELCRDFAHSQQDHVVSPGMWPPDVTRADAWCFWLFDASMGVAMARVVGRSLPGGGAGPALHSDRG